MIWACLRALWSFWWRAPLQLFAFLAGLALATGLWSGVQAINAEARASYDAAAATLGEGQFDQLVPRSGDVIAQSVYLDLRAAGWRVSPVLDVQLNGVRLVGIEPLTTPTTMSFATGGLQIGDADTLIGTAAVAEALRGVAEVTVDPAIAPGVAIADIGAVQRLTGRDDLSRFLVHPDQPRGRPQLADIAPQLALQPSQQVADVAALTDSFHLNLTAFGLLSFAVGLFIVHATIGLAFEQRRGMIRTLRALGVPLRTLLALIAVEMGALALIGAALGVMLGYGVAALLLPDVAATVQGLYGAQVSGTLSLRPEWWLSGFALALLGTGAALAGRIWQIARMPLLASVRPRAWAMAGASRFRGIALAGVALLVVAGGLAAFGSGLGQAFALLGCLLIGAALILPWVAATLLRFAPGSGAITAWFWADTRQQLPGLALALMALLLAVSANIGVSTMVSSFRLTFVAFLDQRLAPELFVRVENAALGAALEDYLDARGLEVLPLLTAERAVAGQPAQLFGVRVGRTYRDSWQFLGEAPGVWDAVAAGEAVVVNEQLARRSGRWVGDRVDVAPGRDLPIGAVVGDYGNPQGQVVMGEALFRSLYSAAAATSFGIRTEDAPALRADLMRDLGLPDSAMINQAAIKGLSLEVFERTFTVTAALNVLTLGVAGFAMLMSLLTLADLRVPQLAPVWAQGVTRTRLGALELARAVGLGVIVFLCALPLGLALAWVLLSIVNVEAFGWQLPMFLFPADYARLGGWALLATVVAAAWPALRLARTPPSALLKVFANER
ncbi:MAG: ABC transporter permease [Pseudomonadota bacterium]